MSRQVLGNDEIEKLEKMPTKAELMAQIAGSINMIPRNIAVCVKSVPTKLAIGVKAISEKEEGEGSS